MKIFFLTLLFITAVNLASYSQDIQRDKLESQIQDTTYSYAYVRVQVNAFSKKLKVDVDFGDTPEQLKASKEYSEVLTNKKSYAAVLNYMAENGFELFQTLELTSSYQGSGGTSGVVFIMMKKK